MRLPRNRLLRALAIFAIVVVALEALYLVVANVVLATLGKKWDAAAPVGVSFDRALTWIPGRVHLRGVRVHGSAGGAFVVAISDADVAFAPWRVASAPRVIDSITAEVTSVDVGARRSKGAMHVVARDVTIDEPNVSFHVDTKVDDATLESGTVVLASGMHGTIALDVAPVDVEKRSLVDTTSGKIALDGVFLSLEPLASFASLATAQDRGTLHVTGALDNGQLGPSSEIRAHTAHATLKDDHGSNADFPRGVDVVVRVAPSAASELQLVVQTPSLVFGSADPARPADVLDDFELSVPAGSSDLKVDALAMRSLEWSTRHALLHEGATTLSTTANGHLHFETRTDGALVADSGFIHGANVTVENADAPDREPFDARLVVERLAVTHESGISLRGPLHATGGDARPLLDVLVTSESIRKNVSGALAHKPFTLDAALNRDDAHVALDDLVLAATAFKLRGAYRRKDKTTRGAFILDDGVLPPIGIAFHDKTESFVIGASSAWLTKALE